MVRAYYPQQMSRSLMSNSNYPPQEAGGIGGVIPPTEILMEYNGTNIIMAYNADWFDLAFLQRIPLTVNGGQVPTTQTNFPILINDTYPDLIGAVEAELRIVDENQVLLDYEIQEFDNSTGLLIAWARQPSLSDGDGFFIYFDNPGASDAQNPTGVWDSTYAMVNHMLSSLLDSTSNDNDATESIAPTTDTDGKIGRARNFDSTDDATLKVLDSNSLDVTEITVSCWLRTAASVNGFAINKDSGGSDRPYSLRRFNNVGRFVTDTGPVNSLTGSIVVPNNTYYYLVGRYNGSLQEIIINAVIDPNTLTPTGDIVITADDLFMGSFNGGSNFLDGDIDEARVSNVARSDDYITTEFNNQNDTSTFYSTGAVEDVSSVIIDMRYNS